MDAEPSPAERVRIADAFIRALERDHVPVDDAVIAAVIQELYGDNPSASEIDAVMSHQADVERVKRGEPPFGVNPAEWNSTDE